MAPNAFRRDDPYYEKKPLYHSSTADLDPVNKILIATPGERTPPLTQHPSKRYDEADSIWKNTVPLTLTHLQGDSHDRDSVSAKEYWGVVDEAAERACALANRDLGNNSSSKRGSWHSFRDSGLGSSIKNRFSTVSHLVDRRSSVKNRHSTTSSPVDKPVQCPPLVPIDECTDHQKHLSPPILEAEEEARSTPAPKSITSPSKKLGGELTSRCSAESHVLSMTPDNQQEVDILTMGRGTGTPPRQAVPLIDASGLNADVGHGLSGGIPRKVPEANSRNGKPLNWQIHNSEDNDDDFKSQSRLADSLPHRLRAHEAEKATSQPPQLAQNSLNSRAKSPSASKSHLKHRVGRITPFALRQWKKLNEWRPRGKHCQDATRPTAPVAGVSEVADGDAAASTRATLVSGNITTNDKARPQKRIRTDFCAEDEGSGDGGDDPERPDSRKRTSPRTGRYEDKPKREVICTEFARYPRNTQLPNSCHKGFENVQRLKGNHLKRVHGFDLGVLPTLVDGIERSQDEQWKELYRRRYPTGSFPVSIYHDESHRVIEQRDNEAANNMPTTDVSGPSQQNPTSPFDMMERQIVQIMERQIAQMIERQLAPAMERITQMIEQQTAQMEHLNCRQQSILDMMQLGPQVSPLKRAPSVRGQMIPAAPLPQEGGSFTTHRSTAYTSMQQQYSSIKGQSSQQYSVEPNSIGMAQYPAERFQQQFGTQQFQGESETSHPTPNRYTGVRLSASISSGHSDLPLANSYPDAPIDPSAQLQQPGVYHSQQQGSPQIYQQAPVYFQQQSLPRFDPQGLAQAQETSSNAPRPQVHNPFNQEGLVQSQQQNAAPFPKHCSSHPSRHIQPDALYYQPQPTAPEPIPRSIPSRSQMTHSYLAWPTQQPTPPLLGDSRVDMVDPCEVKGCTNTAFSGRFCEHHKLKAMKYGVLG